MFSPGTSARPQRLQALAQRERHDTVQKRSFRRARNRLLEHGVTQYRGRTYYAGELGAKGIAQWLETEAVRASLNVVLLQEQWRPTSEFCLPSWTWIQSGAPGRKGSNQHQGVAVLINRRLASDDRCDLRRFFLAASYVYLYLSSVVTG